MTDDDLEADIARLIALRRTRRTLGFQYYETSGTRSRQGKPVKRDRPPRASRANGYQFTERGLAVEVELLATVAAEAHARLVERDTFQQTVSERRRAFLAKYPPLIPSCGYPQAQVGKVGV